MQVLRGGTSPTEQSHYTQCWYCCALNKMDHADAKQWEFSDGTNPSYAAALWATGQPDNAAAGKRLHLSYDMLRTAHSAVVRGSLEMLRLSRLAANLLMERRSASRFLLGPWGFLWGSQDQGAESHSLDFFHG